MATIEGTFENSSSLRVAIVIARFNDLITNKLLSGCLDCLSRHGIDVSESSNQLDIAWVPGAFELPIIKFLGNNFLQSFTGISFLPT